MPYSSSTAWPSRARSSSQSWTASAHFFADLGGAGVGREHRLDRGRGVDQPAVTVHAPAPGLALLGRAQPDERVEARLVADRGDHPGRPSSPAATSKPVMARQLGPQVGPVGLVADLLARRVGEEAGTAVAWSPDSSASRRADTAAASVGFGVAGRAGRTARAPVWRSGRSADGPSSEQAAAPNTRRATATHDATRVERRRRGCRFGLMAHREFGTGPSCGWRSSRRSS